MAGEPSRKRKTMPGDQTGVEATTPEASLPTETYVQLAQAPPATAAEDVLHPLDQQQPPPPVFKLPEELQNPETDMDYLMILMQIGCARMMWRDRFRKLMNRCDKEIERRYPSLLRKTLVEVKSEKEIDAARDLKNNLGWAGGVFVPNGLPPDLSAKALSSGFPFGDKNFCGVRYTNPTVSPVISLGEDDEIDDQIDDEMDGDN